jgi:serine/threonine-protein kinase
LAIDWLGQTIGNWRIDEKIGEGGCGQVFRGVDVMLDRQVAVKVLQPRLAERSDVAERFRVEAHAMARLSHPNVATLYSFHRESDTYVMVMEFVEGETFEALLKREGPMAAERAVPLLLQALDGVGHAHRGGIVHRDLKATNLMLNEAGVVKVMDFGIAQVFGEAASQTASRPVGTPEYMSPEQVRGEALDGRADVYALGVLLFKLLTGRLPIRGDTPADVMRAQLDVAPRPIRTLAPTLSEPVAKAVERAMAKRADDRFADAGTFKAILEQAATAASAASDPNATPQSPGVEEDLDSDVGPTQVMLEPALSLGSTRKQKVVWGGIGSLAASALFGLWFAQTGRVDAQPSDAALDRAPHSPHRLPPLPALPPVGFVEWPLGAGPLAGLEPPRGVLTQDDFASIPVAPSLPHTIAPRGAPEAPPASAAGERPPAEQAKKERAPRAAKPQNRPSMAEQTPVAPAVDPTRPEPGPSPDGGSGWVIRR